MAAPRVYADFQNLDDHNRLKLTCAGTGQDLARQGIQLQEGLILTFYTDDADDQGQPDQPRRKTRETSEPEVGDGLVAPDSRERTAIAVMERRERFTREAGAD